MATSACWTSASPVSQGDPAYRRDDSGLAPVPPSPLEMRIMSAPALATPAATVPTPASETSLTLTLAVGLMHLRS